MRQLRALLASSVPVVCLLVAAMTRRRGHRVAVMAKPVLVVVDDEDISLQALSGELESRYGAHYQVVSSSSAEMALARLAELKAAGADVPLVLADQQMPGMSGTQLLARVRQFFPTARRGLLIPWGERSTPAPFLEAAALGQLEFYLNRPTWSPDEQFHRVITGSLEEWWREQGRRSEFVTVIGDDPSARVHEIRDVLARNNVPFGFYASDSRRAGRRCGGSAWAILLGRCCRCPPGWCWWIRPTPRWARRSGWTCGRAGRCMTWSSWGPGRPAWPPPSTGRRRGFPPRCWSGRRSAARPGRAHGSGTIWVSLMVSAAGSWRSAPTSRRGCSAPTSCTATRQRRWPKTGTCWWSGWKVAARPGPAPW